MFIFNKPKWVNAHKFKFNRYEDIPNKVFDEINARLDLVQKKDPQVSIIIAAWNEEVNILNCISSISCMDTDNPFEIIVVNNNSNDNTQKTVYDLHVTSLFEAVQGCGPARQLGQEHANGEYILLADADCIYPPCWLDAMISKL